MSVEFLVTTLLVAATPGTGVLFTTAAALGRGARAGVVAALGCTLGIVPHIAAALIGLAALLNASAVAFEVVKYLGVAYLCVMAWQTWRASGALRVDTDRTPPSAARVIGSAVLVNLLNPKLTLFFFAFLPPFVGSGSPVPRMLELSAVFMLVTFVVFVGYAAFAASIRSRIIARPRVLTWLRRSFAAAFVALGARLAFAQR
jgi:threonine/homoserine/homoserine lactone efflux protein